MSNSGARTSSAVSGLLGRGPKQPATDSAVAKPEERAAAPSPVAPPKAAPVKAAPVKAAPTPAGVPAAKTMRLSPAVDARLREKFMEYRRTTDPMASFREFCDRMMTAGMDADDAR